MKKEKPRKILVHIQEFDVETFINGLRRLHTVNGVNGDVVFPLSLVDSESRAFLPDGWLTEYKETYKPTYPTISDFLNRDKKS